MSRNGSGIYTPPGASFPAVNNTLIDEVKYNNVINDLASALTASIAVDGQSTITANIPMSSHKLTGLSAGTANGDSMRFDEKDASGGYAGLTLLKINFKNAANTFTNFLTNATTAARTWTFPDRDGTIAMLDDKDASGGYAGLTLFKLNLKNSANTFTNFFTNATTAARTWTLPDKDGTIAMLDDKSLAQQVTYTTSAVATGSTVTPEDNTIPQNTEGDQYLTLAITPTNANSTLEIDIDIYGSTSAGNIIVAALFQDAGANAIATGLTYMLATGSGNIHMKHIMTAGITALTTFNVRVGQANGTFTLNGLAGVGKYGGTLESRITIKEWLP